MKERPSTYLWRKQFIHLIIASLCLLLAFNALAADPAVMRRSLINATTTPFATVQDAYNDAATVDSDEIQCRDILSGENLIFNKPLSIHLLGGYDINFTGQSGSTRVNSLTVSSGTVKVRQVTLVPPTCGNNVKENGERCDDGNLVSGDGCSSTCTVEIQFGGVLTLVPNVMLGGTSTSGLLSFSLPSLSAGSASAIAMTVTPPGGAPSTITKSGGIALTPADLGSSISVDPPATLASEPSTLFTYNLIAMNLFGTSDNTNATLQSLPPQTNLTGGIQRVGATATFLPDGKVLVAGGGRKSNQGACTIVAGKSKSVEIYDPATGSSTLLGNGTPAADQVMSVDRCQHSAVLVGSKVYFIGGANSTTIDVFDTTTNTFQTTSLPTMSTVRLNPTATLLGPASGANSGKIVIAGGYNPSTFESHNSMELFTPGGNTTTYTALLGGGAAGSGRSDHTATLIGKWLFFTGGIFGTGTGVSSSIDAIDTSLVPSGDGAATIVNSTPSYAPARWGHSAIALSSGSHILLLGGADSTNSPTSSVQAYVVNTSNGSISGATTPVNMTNARAYFPVLATHINDKFVVFGGTSSFGTTDIGSTSIELIDATYPESINAGSYFGKTLKTARQHASALNLNIAGASNSVFFVVGGDPGGTASSGTAELIIEP